MTSDNATDAERREQLIGQLRESELFTDLAADQLNRLVRIGKIESFKRNEFIFREGDPGDRFFVVLDGAVRVSRQVPGMGEEALAVLRPGSGFGEMSLIDDSPRSADAIAHESCQVYVVDRIAFEDLLFVDRVMACDLLWKMTRILSRRLRATTDKMTFLSVTGRFE